VIIDVVVQAIERRLRNVVASVDRPSTTSNAAAPIRLRIDTYPDDDRRRDEKKQSCLVGSRVDFVSASSHNPRALEHGGPRL